MERFDEHLGERGEGFGEDDPGEGKEVDPCISLHVTLNKKYDDGFIPIFQLFPHRTALFRAQIPSRWLAPSSL